MTDWVAERGFVRSHCYGLHGVIMTGEEVSASLLLTTEYAGWSCNLCFPRYAAMILLLVLLVFIARLSCK